MNNGGWSHKIVMKKNQRIVSGITATGKLTIGNYFGAIQQFQTLKKDNELFLFIANLHAITTYLQPEQL